MPPLLTRHLPTTVIIPTRFVAPRLPRRRRAPRPGGGAGRLHQLARPAQAGRHGERGRGHTVRVTGAGSTFDAPFFSLAFPAYQQSHPGVTVSYASVGSSAGITRFTAGQADFGATDVPASAADLAGARGGPALQVPVDLGAVTVAYNVLTRNGAPLRLTGPVLAEIFLGQITKWNDPAITALNPGADLPDVYITVVHRSDGSGTTYIFSDYLSTVSPAWAAKVGTGRSLQVARRLRRRREPRRRRRHRPHPVLHRLRRALLHQPAPTWAPPPSPTRPATTSPPPPRPSPPTPPPGPPSPLATSPSSTSPARTPTPSAATAGS